MKNRIITGNRIENRSCRNQGGIRMGGKLWKRAATAVFSAAVLAGTVPAAVPVNAAGTGTEAGNTDIREYTSEGSALVAVTAEVPDRVTADYTVVLPTGVKLEYEEG